MSIEPTAQINLAAMIDKVATEVAAGKFGDVAGCAIFLIGTDSHAVVTLPQEDAHVTAAKFRRAADWCETGVLAP